MSSSRGCDTTSDDESSNDTVGLDRLTPGHLRKWNVQSFTVYSAEHDGDPLQKCDDPSCVTGEQTLYVCGTTEIEKQLRPQRHRQGFLQVDDDARHFFTKNWNQTSIPFGRLKRNPWNDQDVIFHITFFRRREEEHKCITINPNEKWWCFNEQSTTQTLTLWDRMKRALAAEPLGLKSFKARTETAPKAKMCFAKESFTICMLPTSATGARPALYDSSGESSTKWKALVVGSEPLTGGLFRGDVLDEDYLRRRFKHRWPNMPPDKKRALLSNRNAQYFQGLLIEVALREVSQAWRLNVKCIREECGDFTRRTHEMIFSRTAQSEYWRRTVNDDLIHAYRLQNGLKRLHQSINDIIHPTQGIWQRVYAAGLSRTIRRLKGSKGAARGKDQLRKLRGVVNQRVNRHINSLESIHIELGEMMGELRNLRGLLVELSQTRSALYANDLGDTVMWLTLFSIVFLPLGFCTSLWSMNYELSNRLFVPIICTVSAVMVVFVSVNSRFTVWGSLFSFIGKH